jgi:hypothetical protein
MKHDPEMVREARALLKQAIIALPTQNFILASLHTLSVLCNHSLLYIPQQVPICFLSENSKFIQLILTLY